MSAPVDVLEALRQTDCSDDVIAAVAELEESHARLLRLCESARLPKTAEDMMPMVEARRIAANFVGGSK